MLGGYFPRDGYGFVGLICPGGCGYNFAEFPEERHDLDDCPGPQCTCYASIVEAFIGGHQPMCPYRDFLHRKKRRARNVIREIELTKGT